MTDKTFKDYLKEDEIDQEKHDALNNIAMTLGALETEIAELARLDGDMDSSGVRDLTDQLTTMRKLVNSFEDVIDRATGVVPMESRGTMETARPDRESKSDKAQQQELKRLAKLKDLYFNNPNHRNMSPGTPIESVKEDAYSDDMEANLPKIMKMKKALMDKGMKSGDAMDKACEHYGFDPDDVSEYLQKKNESVNEAVDQELMDQVIVQIKRDCDMGDYTAIEELLESCPEANLRGFLSEVEESKDLEYLKKLAGI